MKSNTTPEDLGNKRLRKRVLWAPILLTVAALVLIVSIHGGEAAIAPSLGTASSYSVLAGSEVTNTGGTIVSGDVGVSPGSSITGFPPGVIGGESHSADAHAASAQADNLVAYNALADQACDLPLTGQDLGGLTLTPGVYCFTSSAGLTGTLTLDAEGVGDAVWVFQIASTLTTAPNSSINLIGGALACNVFWQVGSSATLDVGTDFVGNILALTAITANTGTLVEGRLLAQTAAVTLNNNTISMPSCEPSPVPTATPTPIPGATATPIPGATATPIPGATATPIPGATATPIPGATATPIPGATATPIPGATVTPIPGATATPIPGATATPIPGATVTPIPGATATPIPGATATPIPGATATPIPGATATPIPGATATPIPGATATPIPGATATPIPGATATPIPGATATPIPGATATPIPGATATPIPGGGIQPPQSGDGGLLQPTQSTGVSEVLPLVALVLLSAGTFVLLRPARHRS